jgi:hypothetical protein
MNDMRVSNQVAWSVLLPAVVVVVVLLLWVQRRGAAGESVRS